MAYEPARHEQAPPPPPPAAKPAGAAAARDAAAALKRFASKAGQGPLRIGHLFASDGCGGPAGT